MQYPVYYEWDDDEKTAVRYIAQGRWTWKDDHRAVHVSQFALANGADQIDTIIDLSHSTGTPSGATAHVRTFGKQQHPKQTGRTVVIGMEPENVLKLAGTEGILRVANEHVIHFVESEEEAQTLLAEWRRAR